MIRHALWAALALAIVVPPATAAADSRAPLREDARVPSARLQATGGGTMTVVGRMVVNGSIPGRGRVVVIDRRGDATAYLAGVPLRFTDRRAVVRRASGILFVTGSRVAVRVAGRDLTFSIAGNGWARLRGTGTYRLNSGPERSWRRGVIRVTPSSAERRRTRRCASCSSPAASPR